MLVQAMGKKQNSAVFLLKGFIKELHNIMDFGLEKLEDVMCDLAENKTSYVDYFPSVNNSQSIISLIDAVSLQQRKDHLAVLLLLSSDEELRRVIAKLDYSPVRSKKETEKGLWMLFRLCWRKEEII